MANIKIFQASFVSGELDPTLYGRVDTDIYAKAAGLLRNVYVRPQGGAFRREGLEFWNEVTNSAQSRLLPFQFNDEQTYILEFTSGNMVVYSTDSKAVITSLSSSPISNLTDTIISEMNWTQTADTLILFHKDLQPIEITRTSATTFTATNITFTNIPPYAFSGVSTSNPAGSITPDVTTGIVTVTGSGTNFTSSYVGQYLNLPKGGRILVKSVASTTSLEGVVRIELASTSSVSSGSWELESGYEDVISASRGWVRSGTFHKSRLVLGGLGSRPQTIIMSKIGEFYDLDIGEGLDDEAIDITIDDDRVNVIRNVFSGRGLSIFTSGGEFSIRSAVDDPITPGNIRSQLNKETKHGSSQVRPVSVDGAILFVEKSDDTDATKGKVVRQFLFNDAEQSFSATNVSILSNHLISNPVAMDIRKATSTQPANYTYIVNDDGTCAVLSALREQDLLAWSLFDTNGLFEDVVVSGNKTFFIVNRTINSVTKRYIEVLNSDHLIDCSLLKTSGSPTTNWSGFSHLTGETVDVNGDGFVLDDEVVSGGSIMSNESVSSLEAGLGYYARVKSLPLDVVIQGQSFSGEYKNIVFANVRPYQSREFKIVYNLKNHYPYFRELGDGLLDAPVSLTDQWKKVYLGGIGRDLEIEVTQDDPVEFNILCIQYGVRLL